jgi:hypothetical protein
MVDIIDMWDNIDETLRAHSATLDAEELKIWLQPPPVKLSKRNAVKIATAAVEEDKKREEDASDIEFYKIYYKQEENENLYHY